MPTASAAVRFAEPWAKGVRAGKRRASPLCAAAWAAALASFFLVSYGGAGWHASRQDVVASLAFAWEREIPLLPWTIIPYWSLVPLYLAAPFLCRSRGELNALGQRLLTAQAVAVACFFLFPRRFGFVRPDLDGVPGLLFTFLSNVDNPFNQTPSLHVVLSVILGAFYVGLARQHRQDAAWAVCAWFLLISLSVLTTYQHHVLDVPAGVLLGALCLRLRPGDAGRHRTALRGRDVLRVAWTAALVAGAIFLASAGMA